MENRTGFYKQMLINVGLIILVDIVLAFIIALVWNTVGIWLGANSMSYGVALGLSTAYMVADMFIKYWINCFIAIKNAKALEALNAIFAVSVEVSMLKQELKQKSIL